MTSTACPNCGAKVLTSQSQCSQCGTTIGGSGSGAETGLSARHSTSTSPFVMALQLFALVGAGLGLTGVVMLYRIGGGAGGSLRIGILATTLLTFTMFLGPVVAIVVSVRLAGHGRLTTSSCFVANAVGYLAMVVILAGLLTVGIDLAGSGGGSSLLNSDRFTTLVALSIPTGLTGVGATLWASFNS